MDPIEKINPKSQYVISDRLNLFNIPPTLAQIREVFYTRYETQTLISECGKSGGTLVYIIPRDSNFTDLSQCFLYFKIQLVQNLTTVASTDPVSVCNNLGYSLIKHTEISLNGRSITPSFHTEHYKKFLESILFYGKNAKDTRLRTWGFADDQPGKMNSLLSYDPTEKKLHTDNSGLLTRRNLFNAATGTAELCIPLPTDLASCSNLLLNDIDMQIKLILNNKKFVIMCNDLVDYDFVLKQAYLYMCRVKADVPSIRAINTMLSHGETAKYPFRQNVVRLITLNEGVNTFVIDPVYLGRAPVRAIAGFVRSSAVNGKFSKNPFNFEHFHLTNLRFILDGKSYPSLYIQPSFDNNEFIRYYLELMRMCGISASNPDSNGISLEQYSNGLTLFGVEFAPSAVNEIGVFSEVKRGPLRIELQFKDNLTEPVTMVLYLEYENLLELNFDRKPHFQHSI